MRPFLLLFLLACCYSLLQGQPCREVVGFYPSWKWYDRGRLVNPATIDYSKYTIINYAFLRPDKDGSVSLFDPFADKTILLGKIKPAVKKSYKKNKALHRRWHEPGTSLVEQAHARGVKVLLSIGGWTMSDNFSHIAASPKKRQRFAESCARLVRIFGVDGVDIDWEYPGYKPAKGHSGDRHNFTLLIQAVRRAFDQLETQTGTELLLTADFGAGASHTRQIEWTQVVPLLDFVNVMTYDYYGSRPGYTNHHAPLYAPRKGVEGYDLNSTVRELTGNYGVPPEKINIGLAFFGRSIKTRGKARIHSKTRRIADEKTFPEDKGAPAYYNLLARQNLFDYHWDDCAEVPYLNGKKLNTFVTFDDELSIRKKAQYILNNGLAGAIVWDITGDCIESKKRPGTIENTPLADALRETLCQQKVEMPAMTRHAGNKAPAQNLPQQWSLLTHHTFAPRVAQSTPVISKKEKRIKKKRRKKKNKSSVPHRYFDGGW